MVSFVLERLLPACLRRVATGSGEPQQVKTAPTVKQGARSRLDALQQKTADAAAKAGKKK